MSQAVEQFLGLSKRSLSPLDLANSIEHGLPTAALDLVKDALGLPDERLSHTLDISTKTLSRQRAAKQKRLSLTVGDRVYRLARIIVLAYDVFEDQEAAGAWLKSPQIGLAGRTPIELLTTEVGTREVENLLLRIEYGVIS